MENTLNAKPLSEGDKAYYQQRQRNRLYETVISLFVKRAEEQNLTKKDLSFITGKDKATITRCLSAPSNLTLDTISDLLLAMDAELDFAVLDFSEQALLRHNFVHPLLVDCEKSDGVWMSLRFDGESFTDENCNPTFSSTNIPIKVLESL